MKTVKVNEMDLIYDFFSGDTLKPRLEIYQDILKDSIMELLMTEEEAGVYAKIIHDLAWISAGLKDLTDDIKEVKERGEARIY